jgi:hypothetical protein
MVEDYTVPAHRADTNITVTTQHNTDNARRKVTMKHVRVTIFAVEKQ